MEVKIMLSFENVLGRLPREIQFDSSDLEILQKQKILITGAGGSIGSRIAIALSDFGIRQFICTDRDESALHSLSLEVNSSALFEDDNFWLLDIKDLQRVHQLVKDYKPTVIIHAAALKHLSVLEKQPEEALSNNIYGTLNLLEAAIANNVEYFVNVSTDKAADPESVLGRSKYLTELLTSFHKYNHGKSYMNVRFGNVFASRGSVIETFVAQISKSRPITLTDARVSRFFMHEDEAALLTLKALVLNEGDINLFDMGEPVNIAFVIQRLQELLQGESLIVETGLRKGEKLVENLFAGIEESKYSSDPLIRVSTHSNTIIRNNVLIQDALKRSDSSLMQYLRSDLKNT